MTGGAAGPVVGIAGTRRTLHLPFADVDAHTAFTGYVDALVVAGGVPVVLPPGDPGLADRFADAVDAVVLTGGPDLVPAVYGAVPHPATGQGDIGRDRFELALVAAARRRRIPVLGVCRGLHVLNAAAGGTLRQHVEGHAGRGLRHRIDVRPGSRLHSITGPSAVTGSLHHQAVDRLGRGLRVVATASDGVVEAVEARDRSPVLAVQWHPELEDGAVSRGLFRWVVEAAARGTAPGAEADGPAARQWSA